MLKRSEPVYVLLAGFYMITTTTTALKKYLDQK